MKRKPFVIILLIILLGCATTDNLHLVGTWELVEFSLIGTGGDPVSNEKTLRDAGAVWDIDLSKNGNFRQDFNMRRSDMTMESEKGSWTATEDSLLVELDFDTTTSILPYVYKIENDLLVLTLTNEFTNASVVTKFRKKKK
jgi:hypothetical protein